MRRATAIVFAGALVLQGVLALDDRDDPFRHTLVSDARSYAAWAERLAREGLAAEPTFYQAPLFPLLLAAAWGDGGPAPMGAWLALQAVLSAAAVALLVPIGALAFGRTDTGVAAASAAALHGALPFHALKLLPTSLALATQGAAVLAVLAARRRAGLGTAALAGALCGLAALARAELLVFVPVAAFAVATPGPRRLLRAGALALAAALAIAPATLHNLREGGLVPIASSGGDNLYVGNQRGATGAVGALDPRAGDLFSMRVLSRRLAEEAAGRPLNPAEVSAHWGRAALREIAADPAGFAVLLGRKLARVFHPGDPSDLYSLPLERALYLPTLQPLRLSALPLLALAALGIALCAREGGLARAWPLLALAACQLAMLLAFFVSTRLRLPLFYALTPFAGHAVLRVLAWPRRRLLAAATGLLFLVLLGAAGERPQARDHLRLASVLSTQGRLQEGLAVLRGCPEDALCMDQRGWILQKEGRIGEAAAAYRAALARGLPPGRAPSTHSRLAQVLERQGRLDEAAREHDAAVADPAGGAGARLERALFRARRGDLAGAREDLAEAQRQEPGWPEPARAAASLGIAL